MPDALSPLSSTERAALQAAAERATPTWPLWSGETWDFGMLADPTTVRRLLAQLAETERSVGVWCEVHDPAGSPDLPRECVGCLAVGVADQRDRLLAQLEQAEQAAASHEAKLAEWTRRAALAPPDRGPEGAGEGRG